MNLDLEIEFSNADLLNNIDTLKKQIDDMQLSDEIKNRVMQKLRLDWNYNSNAIEGNKLNYGETVAFLMTGITAKGKPLKDYLDIKGHNEAILFLTSIVKEDRPLMEADIRALHKMILVEPYEVKAQTADGSPTSKMISIGEYKTQANHVETATGEIHYYSTPEETPIKMRELMEWYAEASANPTIHPVAVAALFHHKFVEIHPFDDGNGRLSRILMNLILMKNSYPPAIIKMDDRQNYYALLSQADVNDSWPFVEYIAERLENSLQLYLKAARGEDIDEDDDIDKEIELFKRQVQNEVNVQERRNAKVTLRVINDVVKPFTDKFLAKGRKFKELFLMYGGFIVVELKKTPSKPEVYLKVDDQLLNHKEDYFESIRGLNFVILLDKFRKHDNDFDVKIQLNLSFNDYQYEFLDYNDEILISKLYHENLSKEEENSLIKFAVEGIQDQIQFNLNNYEDRDF